MGYHRNETCDNYAPLSLNDMILIVIICVNEFLRFPSQNECNAKFRQYVGEFTSLRVQKFGVDNAINRI